MRIAFLISVVLATGPLASSALSQSKTDLPPGLQKSLEEAQRSAHEAMNGPAGDEARRICMRVAGVSFPARTAPELIRAGYSLDVAEKYGDCVMNYLFPIDAKKR
jgi:hypothetical protein